MGDRHRPGVVVDGAAIRKIARGGVAGQETVANDHCPGVVVDGDLAGAGAQLHHHQVGDGDPWRQVEVRGRGPALGRD